MVSNLWFVTAKHCVTGLAPSQVSVSVQTGSYVDNPSVEQIVSYPTPVPPSTAPDRDVAMVRVALPGADINSSYTGFSRSIYQGTTAALYPTLVYCTGSGGDVDTSGIITGLGQLRSTSNWVWTTALSGTRFGTTENFSGQIQTGGDSGGGCYDNLGQLLGVTIQYGDAVHPWVATVECVEGFRDWMNQVMAPRIGVFNNGQWWLDVNGTRVYEGGDAYFASFGAGGLPFVRNTGVQIAGIPRYGRSHIGAFFAGTWYVDTNDTGVWGDTVGTTSDTYISPFGGAGDIPFFGQWFGSNLSQSDPVGVFRSGQWFLDGNANSSWNGYPPDVYYPSFGAGITPVVGAWTFSFAGKRSVGAFSAGSWWLDTNGNGTWEQGVDTYCSGFGQAGDKPIVGDWNGNGVEHIGVYNSGSWWLDYNGSCAWDAGDVSISNFGQPGDTPVVGRW
jgi:hypothetical protein